MRAIYGPLSHTLFSFPCSFLSLLCQSSRVLCHSFESFSFFLLFFLSLSLLVGQAGRGQGESPRAAGGLLEGAADGEQERTVYNIVMIQ